MPLLHADIGPALLNEIVANPEENDLRLRYADWLGERNEGTRAEYIRNSIRYEGGHVSPHEQVGVMHYHLHLEQEVEAADQAVLRGIVQGERVEAVSLQYDRGLPRTLAIPLEDFLTHGAQIQAAFPTLRDVAVYVDQGKGPLADQLGQLGDCAALSGFSGLKIITNVNLGDAFDGHDMEQLTAGSHVKNIRRLGLTSNNLQDSALEALGDAPLGGQLRELNIAYNDELSSAGLRGLLSGRHAPRLTSLDLNQCAHMGESLGEVFAAATTLGDLKNLNISGTRITGHGLARMLSNPGLNQLEVLSASDNPLQGAEGMRALAISEAAKNLTQLTLSSSRIDTPGMQELVRLPAFPKLKSLRLGYNHLLEANVERLMRASFIPQLEELSLTVNTVTTKALETLSSRRPEKLAQLYLRGCNVQDEGVEALLERPLPALGTLDLSNNQQLSTRTAQCIADTTHLPQLGVLCLNRSGLGEDGTLAIVNSPNLDKLGSLEMRQAGMGEHTVRALSQKKNLPNLMHLAFDDRIGEQQKTAITRRLNDRIAEYSVAAHSRY